jgi:hypothetical protein
MDVKDRLPRFTIAVEERAVAALVKTTLARDGPGAASHLADQGIISRRELIQRGDVPARQDQGVQRRLWVDILNDDDPFVLVENGRGDLARDDLAEQTVSHGGQSAGESWRAITAVRGIP